MILTCFSFLMQHKYRSCFQIYSAFFKSLFLVSGILYFLGPTVERLMSCDGWILSWQLLCFFYSSFCVSVLEMILILGINICSFLCWVVIMFPGFCCPFRFLWECGGCVLPCRKCFWGLSKCGHWVFWLEYVSWYWELTLRDGDGPRCPRESTGERTQCVPPQSTSLCRNGCKDVVESTPGSVLQSWRWDWGVGFGGKKGEWCSEDCLSASMTICSSGQHEKWVNSEWLQKLVAETKDGLLLKEREDK